MKYAEILLDNALNRPLDYEVPSDFRESIAPGMRVEVPLQSRKEKGTVWKLKETSAWPKVKAISSLFPDLSLSKELFELCLFVARYYGAPLYRVISSALPPSVKKGMSEKRQLFVRPLLSKNELVEVCKELREKSSPQASVLDALLQSPKGLLLSELMSLAAVTRSPIATLAKRGVLSLQELIIERDPLEGCDFFPTSAKKLHGPQQKCLDAILSSKEGKPHLLYGITGSGKTEIYLQAIAHTLSQGKTALFLIPEIALTSQTVERLRGRFEGQVALVHSRLSEGQRRDTWKKISEGKAPIVLGARSALFSPLPNLGLIIVDEEHDNAYKQSDEAPTYHARDVAVMRGKLSGATVILGSATPSFESYANAQKGKYELHTLTKRAEKQSLPSLQIIDMNHEKSKGLNLFSDSLLSSLKAKWELGEQTMLFLNRRGFHSAQFCPKCREAIRCPHCDTSLTYHRGEEILACHLCNYTLSPPPRNCPTCGEASPLKYRGAGTEQVERALGALFPSIRTLRLDADTTRHKGSHEELFKKFRSGKADVLIGTQMIAKGLHFPSVTLVGILNADTHLQIPDFRSAESTFQLIAQVAGRAGRGELPGEVIIQTYMPDLELISIAAKGDFDTFYHKEIESRKAFGFPPFTRLVKLLFSAKDEQLILSYAKELQNKLLPLLPSSCALLPLIPCGHTKIKDLFRFQLLFKAESTPPVVQAIQKVKELLPPPRALHFLLDVDPISTFF